LRPLPAFRAVWRFSPFRGGVPIAVGQVGAIGEAVLHR